MKLIAIVLTGLVPIAAALLPTSASEPATAAHIHSQSQGQEPAANATPRRATVIFMRHAEALPRTKGNQNPDLSDAGKARAILESKTLAAAGVTRIFATELKRTQQTAAPLAKLLGLKVEQYPARKSKAFTDTLRNLKDGEVAVVVGHSNTVPVMVHALGGQLKGLDRRGYLLETQHDRMIVQTLASAKSGLPMTALQTLDLRIN